MALFDDSAAAVPTLDVVGDGCNDQRTHRKLAKGGARSGSAANPTLRAHGPNKALRDPVRMWHLNRGSHDPHPSTFKHVIKAAREFAHDSDEEGHAKARDDEDDGRSCRLSLHA
jgi:hypothetical protein